MYRPVELIRPGDFKMKPECDQLYKIAGLQGEFRFTYYNGSGNRCSQCALRGADGGKGDFCKMFLCGLPEVYAERDDDEDRLPPDSERDAFIGEGEAIGCVNRLFDECATTEDVEETEADLRLKLYCEKDDAIDVAIKEKSARAKENIQLNAGSGRRPVVGLLLDNFVVRFQPEQNCAYRFFGLKLNGKEQRAKHYRFERHNGIGSRCDCCALRGSNVCEMIFCGGNANTNRGLYGLFATEVEIEDLNRDFAKIVAKDESPALAPVMKLIAFGPNKKTAKPRKKADDAKQEPSDDWKELQETLAGNFPPELTDENGEKKLDVAKALGFQSSYVDASKEPTPDKRSKWEDALRKLETEAAQEDFRAELLRADMKEHMTRAKKLRQRICELIKKGSDEFQSDEPLFEFLSDVLEGDKENA